MKNIRLFHLLLDFFSSVRLAVFVLSLLMLVCIVGALAPQEHSFTSVQLENWLRENPVTGAMLKSLGLFDAFDSWIFYAVLALFLCNLFLCTLKLCLAKRAFFRLPFSVCGIRHWGIVICHLGLLLLATSIFIDRGFGSEGMFLVRENSWFDAPTAIYRGRRYHYGWFCQPEKPGPPTTDFRIYFDKLTVDYQREISTDRSFHVLVEKDGNTTLASIAPNRPLKCGDYSFTMDEYGFAPRLALWNERHEQIVCDFVFLDPLERTSIEEQHNEISVFCTSSPESGPKLRLKIEFYPDAAKINAKNLKVENRGYALKNPVFVLTLWRAGKIIGRQLLCHKNLPDPSYCRIGKYTIGVDRIDYWCTFHMLHSPALPFVYLSMWICLFGIVLCYLKNIFESLHENI